MLMTESKAGELEEKTREKVIQALSPMEVALAEWEGAKEKPPDLAKRIDYIRLAHKLFSEWAKESMRGELDKVSTMKRLRRFTEICNQLRVQARAVTNAS